MKLKRQLAAVGGALALVTAGASVALVGGISASSAADAPSSAFGLDATGLVPIAATPSVTSTSGSLVTDSLVSLPDNPLITGGVVDVQAQNGSAESDVTNLKVGGGLLDQLSGPLSTLTTQLQPVCDALGQVPTGTLNTAVGDATSALGLQGVLDQVSGATGVDLSLVTALDLSKLLPEDLSGICDVLAGKAGLLNVGTVTTECHGTNGTVSVANLTALGLPVQIDTSKANSSVSIPGILTITANRQTHNANGTFTVDGLYVSLLGGQQTLTITSATCGHVAARQQPTSPASNAPAPTPVHTRAPVTG